MSKGNAIGLTILCIFLNLSCFESGEPTEPPHPEVPAKPTITALDISAAGASAALNITGSTFDNPPEVELRGEGV